MFYLHELDNTQIKKALVQARMSFSLFGAFKT